MMKTRTAQDKSSAPTPPVAGRFDARRLPAPAWAAALAVSMVSLLGCAGTGEDEVVIVTGSASNPDIIVVTAPSSTPGPNDPLTLFEQRRLLARIQQDPQRQLQRLSLRERRGLAAMALAAQQAQEQDQ